jgi:hypothetical protein
MLCFIVNEFENSFCIRVQFVVAGSCMSCFLILTKGGKKDRRLASDIHSLILGSKMIHT